MKSFPVILLILTIYQVQSVENKPMDVKLQLTKNLKKNSDWPNQSNNASTGVVFSGITNVISSMSDSVMKEMTLLRNLDNLLAKSQHKYFEKELKKLYASVESLVAAERGSEKNMNIVLNHIVDRFYMSYVAYVKPVQNWIDEQSRNLLGCDENVQDDVSSLLSDYFNLAIINIDKCVEDSLLEFSTLTRRLSFLSDYFGHAIDSSWANIAECINLSSNMMQKYIGCKKEIRRAIKELRSGIVEFKKNADILGKVTDVTTPLDYCFVLASTNFHSQSQYITEEIFDMSMEMCFNEKDTNGNESTEIESSERPSSESEFTSIEDDN